jgi:protein-S-isoprenylcysteine O-methyltransferase Ste14
MKRDWIKRVTPRTMPIYLAIAVLVLFASPTPHSLLIGLALATAGEALRIWAAGHLRKTKEVTTSGPYAYVKNPLYLGTLLIMIGFCTMARNLPLLIVGLAVFVIYYAPFKKRREGGRLAEKFGEAWTAYDRAVPDYLPRFTPYPQRKEQAWDLPLFFENSEDGTLIAVMLGVAALGLRMWFQQ